jgi:hypothetical protein
VGVDVSQRVLFSSIRSVPASRSEAYQRLWDELRRASRDVGANAWRFVSGVDGQRHIEFLEFAGAADPRKASMVRHILERMDAEIAAAQAEEWVEVAESV